MRVCVSHDELHPWVAEGGDKIRRGDTVLRMGSLEQADCSLSPEKKSQGSQNGATGAKDGGHRLEVGGQSYILLFNLAGK